MFQAKPHVARTTTYLHFLGTAKEAFMYYKSVFGVNWMFNSIEN